jgi:hypothetical protein
MRRGLVRLKSKQISAKAIPGCSPGYLRVLSRFMARLDVLYFKSFALQLDVRGKNEDGINGTKTCFA